jgi:hypothetical protein
MKILLYLVLLCCSILTKAQSNWLLEGDAQIGLLSKSFAEKTVKGELGNTLFPPTPIGLNFSTILLRQMIPNFYAGLGLSYHTGRNGHYITTFPYELNLSTPPTIGYYRAWNYIDIPLIVRYSISKKWSVQLKLSNSFLVGYLDRFWVGNNWQDLGELKSRTVSGVTSDRFHSIGLSVNYTIPLKNKHSLVVKGFYDYVALGAAPSNTSSTSTIPHQFGIGVAYQIPHLFEKKGK